MTSAWKAFLLITLSLAGCLILLAGYIYLRLATPSYELNRQLKQLLMTGPKKPGGHLGDHQEDHQGRDANSIKSIAYDEVTQRFLSDMPKGTPVSASDFQGSDVPQNGIEIGYFPAKIGSTPINCYMATKTNSFSLIPHWKLVMVSLKPVGIDLNWAW